MAQDWFKDLEGRVDKAIAELERLRRDNGTLKKQVERLNQQLAEAKSSGAGAADWEKERDAIRKRVERLVAGLEQTLGS